VRLLHVADRLSTRGGADWHLLGLLRELGREGDTHLAVGRNEVPTDDSWHVTIVPGMDAGSAAAIDTLDALAHRLSPDVIHLHNCMDPGVLRWGAARGAILTVQDHRVFCPGRGKLTLDGRACREPMAPSTCASCFEDHEYFERMLDVTRRRLDALGGMGAVIVLSRYMRDELVAVGVDAARIAVIPPFVHGLDTTATPDGPPCVLFVGRLVAAKGVFDVVEAHRQSGVGLPLVFAGTGSQRAGLETAGCDVLGWVPHDRLASVYKRARVLVMPSRWQEPLGIVGLEALTMGLPVVAWDSGGVREWLADVTPWGDIGALARALRATLEIGSHGRLPDGFDRATLMTRLRDLYSVVANARDVGPSRDK
jgi:glycosyltransferase involved in cell wall biosynthesis